ncbi:MAG: filamentous hemagglutinin family protein, partial [Pseudomonadales bacterium]|nr:filamentous hemagglutinin family protein [Pseudomonadales bacterium]
MFSTIQTEDGGDVNIFTPGGGVDVGLTSNLIKKPSGDLGIFAKTTGSISMFSEDSIEVNLSRIFALNGGDVMLWSSNGDVDAGKGARSAQSLPPPLVTVNEKGEIKVIFSPAIDGSGIGGFTQPGVEPGDVFLFAPRGVVDAGEAGIRAGRDIVIGG